MADQLPVPNAPPEPPPCPATALHRPSWTVHVDASYDRSLGQAAVAIVTLAAHGFRAPHVLVRLVAAPDNNEAELLALLTAVRAAPHGTQLTAGTDSLTAWRQCHTDPTSQSGPAAQAIARAQRERRVTLTVTPMPRTGNRAHDHALRALRGARIATHTARAALARRAVRATVHPAGTVTFRGGHLGCRLPCGARGAVDALLAFATRVPPRSAVTVRGLGPLATTLWHDPTLSPDPTLTAHVQAAHAALRRRGSTLRLKESS